MYKGAIFEARHQQWKTTPTMLGWDRITVKDVRSYQHRDNGILSYILVCLCLSDDEVSICSICEEDMESELTCDNYVWIGEEK